MKKVLDTKIINGLLAVDIEGELHKTKIGDLIPDNAGNVFRLDSVALTGSYNPNSQILVLHKLEGNKPIGTYLDAN